jgi:phosphate transport system ATP-binding protein
LLETPVLEARNLTVTAGTNTILRDLSFGVRRRQAFAIIGASGAGKSTLLKSLNRLLDLSPQFKIHGEVLLNGESVYSPKVDVDRLRVRVGMVFQQPVVFPKSIYQNVLLGIRHQRTVSRKLWPQSVERALREAALWDEVKDRLHSAASCLSVGQQQRLCIARTLAVGPEVILMDEPTSALDPKATEAIEEVILRLKADRTIVVVTHNLGQARRIADSLALITVHDGAGQIAESGCCIDIFNNPQSAETNEFLSQERRMTSDKRGSRYQGTVDRSETVARL